MIVVFMSDYGDSKRGFLAEYFTIVQGAGEHAQ
jgi:hypothetical protein